MDSQKRFRADKFMVRNAIARNQNLDINNFQLFLEVVRNDNVFQEQLMIANKKLYDMLHRYYNNMQMKQKKIKQLSESIYNYYKRSYQRSTPFGLFSEVTVGTFGEKSILSLGVRTKKTVLLDAEWLITLVHRIEKEYSSCLEFTLNRACFLYGDRVHQLYSINSSETEEVNIKMSKVYQLVADKCNNKYSRFQNIIGAIINEYGDEYKQLSENYVKELVENHYLLSRLQQGLIQKFTWDVFLKQVEEIDDRKIYIDKLRQIYNMIQQYQLLKIGDGLDILNQIFNVMETLVQTNNYLQVDLCNDSRIVLPLEVKEEAEAFAVFFVDVSKSIKRTYLDDYREKFLEKYGISQEVQLIELFDASTGIGAPYDYMHPKNEFFENEPQTIYYSNYEESLYLSEYERALRTKSEINLNKFREYYNSLKWDKTPKINGFDLFFNLSTVEGKSILCLGSIGGSNNLGGSSGRFSILSDELYNYHKNITDMDENENITSCEIHFIPENLRHANIMRTAMNRNVTLPLFTDVCGDTVSIENIFIGIDSSENFYARDIESGNIMCFYVTSMYNRFLFSNEIRFLNEISINNNLGYLPWNLIYKKFNYIPRIVFENIIVAPAKWKISTEYLGEDVDTILEKTQLPEKFYIENNDNRILIDITQKLDVLLFTSIIQKELSKGNQIEITECISDICLLEKESVERTADIVIPFINMFPDFDNKRDLKRAQKRISLEKRLKIPFDDWLYLKLFIPLNRQEEFILDYIPHIMKIVKEEGGGSLFYLRYADPKPQIRLRIKSVNLFLIFSKITNILSKCIESRIVSSFDITTYDREIERYGGVLLIERAEKIFFLDTEITLETFDLSRNPDNNLNIDDLSILVNYIYLKAFFQNDNKAIILFLDEVVPRKNQASNQDKLHNRILIRDYINSNKLFKMLPKMNQLVKEIVQFCEKSQKQLSNIERYSIVDSIIHVHNNRLIGINRVKEEIIYEKIKGLIISEEYMREE